MEQGRQIDVDIFVIRRLVADIDPGLKEEVQHEKQGLLVFLATDDPVSVTRADPPCG